MDNKENNSSLLNARIRELEDEMKKKDVFKQNLQAQLLKVAETETAEYAHDLKTYVDLFNTAEEDKTKLREENSKLRAVNQRLSENCKTMSHALEQETTTNQTTQSQQSIVENELRTINHRLSENCKTLSQALEQEIKNKQIIQAKLSEVECELKLLREKPFENNQVLFELYTHINKYDCHYLRIHFFFFFFWVEKKKRSVLLDIGTQMFLVNMQKVMAALLNRVKVKGNSIKELDEYVMKSRNISEQLVQMATEKGDWKKECVEHQQTIAHYQQQLNTLINQSDNKNNIEVTVLKSENDKLRADIRLLEEHNNKLAEEASMDSEKRLNEMAERLHHLQENQSKVYKDYEMKLALANDEKLFLKNKCDRFGFAMQTMTHC
ncbi:hypothetical protein RFI_20903 [Reticulomyxa filosa]|uniref:Viral A-type inclusion protein n=1 Tax=Reticulomyxa filosa TaxID=46433 RepID=X6MS11_RETFI|nr:hypothetical protein RFI_20903 [Reticulomyxa filosa]|eukprot:ETO16436.1 hypothetical protein RFI_20903 [Reticulomyxa filosa]